MTGASAGCVSIGSMRRYDYESVSHPLTACQRCDLATPHEVESPDDAATRWPRPD